MTPMLPLNQALELSNNEVVSRTAERILALILRHNNSLDSDSGRARDTIQSLHLEKIRSALRLGQAISFVLPAFPAKSPNPEKTLGKAPDFAEVLGLKRLQRTCDEIATFYSPGAEVLICSDGRVFSDLVLVSDQDVSDYGAKIREIISEFNLASLRTFSMEDVFEGANFQLMRERLVALHGRPLEEIRSNVLGTEEGRAMFNGIHRFVFEDRAVLEKHKSRNKVREDSKLIAYRVIQRSNAWSSLVEALFPDSLRLSIHPQFASSGKIGFQLVTCTSSWGTPWHNVALLCTDGFHLVKRREAEARGAVLEYALGKYPYFKEVSQCLV